VGEKPATIYLNKPATFHEETRSVYCGLAVDREHVKTGVADAANMWYSSGMKDFIHSRIARARNPQLFISRNPQHFMKKPAAFSACYAPFHLLVHGFNEK
jgi:hypothetical protein